MKTLKELSTKVVVLSCIGLMSVVGFFYISFLTLYTFVEELTE